MFSSGTQSIRLNPKLFLIDIKSFADNVQLNFAISKNSRILIIFLLEGKLWAVGFAGPDWLATRCNSTQLSFVLKVWQNLISLNRWKNALVEIESIKNIKSKNC